MSAPRRVAECIVLAVIVVIGFAACGGGSKTRSGSPSPQGVARLRVVATTVLSARTRDLTVASPALGGTVHVQLLVPAHCAAQPERRWPVLYLLQLRAELAQLDLTHHTPFLCAGAPQA